MAMSEIRAGSDMLPELGELRERARWNWSIDRRQAERGTAPWLSFGVERDPNLGLAIKTAAALDLKECRWSREQVAEGLSVMLNRPVTLAQIDAVVSETHPHRFAAEWIPAWVRITGSRRLLELLCAAAGLWLADGDDVDAADFGRVQLRIEKLGGKAAELKSRLWERINP
jgi:hypothetical protein